MGTLPHTYTYTPPPPTKPYPCQSRPKSGHRAYHITTPPPIETDNWVIQFTPPHAHYHLVVSANRWVVGLTPHQNHCHYCPNGCQVTVLPYLISAPDDPDNYWTMGPTSTTLLAPLRSTPFLHSWARYFCQYLCHLWLSSSRAVPLSLLLLHVDNLPYPTIKFTVTLTVPVDLPMPTPPLFPSPNNISVSPQWHMSVQLSGKHTIWYWLITCIHGAPWGAIGDSIYISDFCAALAIIVTTKGWNSLAHTPPAWIYLIHMITLAGDREYAGLILQTERVWSMKFPRVGKVS